MSDLNSNEVLNIEETELIPVDGELEIPEEKTSNGGAIIVAALAIYGGYKLGKKGGKLAVKGVKKGKTLLKEKFKKEEEPEIVTDIVEVEASE